MGVQTLLANPNQTDQEFVSDPANAFIRLKPQQRLDPVLTADSSIACRHTSPCVTFLSHDPPHILLHSQAYLVSKTALASQSALELVAHHQPLALQHLGVLPIPIEQPRPADGCLERSVNFITTMMPQSLLLAQLSKPPKYFKAALACHGWPIGSGLIYTTARTTSARLGIYGND